MNLFKLLAQLKVYYSRSGVYLSLFNSLLLLGTFKVTYDIQVPFYVFVVLGATGALLIGYLDYKLLLKHEVAHSNKQNDIKHQLNRIESLVK